MGDKYIALFFFLLILPEQAFSACRYAENAPKNGYFTKKSERINGGAMRKAGNVELACNEGYRLDPEGAFRSCVNIDGKLKWKELTASCNDINECQEGVFPIADKEDTGGSFSSFSSSSSSNAAPEPEDACDKDAECTNTVGSYKCKCEECYIGDGKHCERYNPPCNNLQETLENGVIQKTSHKITYKCNENYKAKFSQRYCKCGKWLPSDDISPTCKFQGCAAPTDIENGRVIYYTLTHGSASLYICNEGYELRGSKERTCKVSGEWSPPEPICKPVETFADVAVKFKESFVDKVGSYSNTSSASGALQGRLAANAVGLDIIFAFDASSSIGETDFQYGVNFAKLLVDEFGVSYDEGGTRISAIMFASGAQVVFNFNDEDADTVDKVKAKIQSISQRLGGGTAMQEAFERIFEDVVPEMRGAAKRALFMMTDGESNDGNPAAAAKRLRESEDIEIFAIGIGAQVDRRELNSIANTPYSSHVFLIKSFSDLQTLSEIISEERVDFNRCGVAIDIDIEEAKKKELTQESYEVEIPNSWPWVASISRIFKNTDFYKHICGGTLICNQWVLTAASCINRNSKPLRTEEILVTLGQYNQSSDAEIEVQERDVEEIILSDNFVRNTYGRDLALIKLKTPVVLASYVRTACLGNANDVLNSVFEDKCYTIGWGARDPLNKDEEHHEILTQLRMPVQIDEECNKKHATIFREQEQNLLCAGSREAGKSACVGDVGGALVCLRYDDTWAVVGVAVPNSECYESGKYGIYTRPDRFTEWINDYTSNCLDKHLNIFN